MSPAKNADAAALREFREILDADALLFQLAEVLGSLDNPKLLQIIDRLRAENAARLAKVQAKAYPLLDGSRDVRRSGGQRASTSRA
jgi:hypothetical protein